MKIIILQIGFEKYFGPFTIFYERKELGQMTGSAEEKGFPKRFPQN